MKNQYETKKPNRKSIRLKDYDYSQQGLYFVTICVQGRFRLFGKVINGKMILNEAGQMIKNEWLKIPKRFPNTALHQHIVMPNHFHAIIQIVGANPCGCPTPKKEKCTCKEKVNRSNENEVEIYRDREKIYGGGQPRGLPQRLTRRLPRSSPRLGDIIGAFKSIVTVEYIRGVKTKEWKRFNGRLLQRNYYEHIIRNMNAYINISNYIEKNPEKWEKGKFYIQ